MRLTDEALEVSLVGSEASCLLPHSAHRVDGGCGRWRGASLVASRLESESGLAGTEAPSPALVTLGRDDAGLVLLDVEHAGSVEVVGSQSCAVLHSVVLELATARWFDQVDLVLIGLDVDMDGMDRVRSTPSIAAVQSEVRRKIEERQALMRVIGQPSSWAWVTVDGWRRRLGPPRRGGGTLGGRGRPADRPGAVRACEDGSNGVIVLCGSGPVGARWHVLADGGPVEVRAPELDGSILVHNTSARGGRQRGRLARRRRPAARWCLRVPGSVLPTHDAASPGS